MFTLTIQVLQAIFCFACFNLPLFCHNVSQKNIFVCIFWEIIRFLNTRRTTLNINLPVAWFSIFGHVAGSSLLNNSSTAFFIFDPLSCFLIMIVWHSQDDLSVSSHSALISTHTSLCVIAELSLSTSTGFLGAHLSFLFIYLFIQ